jgi:very-long-chain enoyl-CoA reductase
MLNVEVKLGEKRLDLNLSRITKVGDIKDAVGAQLGIPRGQVRLELPTEDGQRIVLNNEQTLDDFRTHLQGTKLTLSGKNLGSQIPYSSLFYIEYGFPPLSVLFFYLLNLKNVSSYNTLLTFCVVLHFGKRLLETKYVHIFSTPSVPFKVLLRNCLHYWLLIGVLLPIEVFFIRSPSLGCCSTILFLVFLSAEAGNLYCHIALRRLREVKRPNGSIEITNERKIPSGLFFDQIIAPNYTFEILAWVAFTLLFKTLVGVVFTALSGFIMTVWAVEKKRKLVQSSLDSNEKQQLRAKPATIPFVV